MDSKQTKKQKEKIEETEKDHLGIREETQEEKWERLEREAIATGQIPRRQSIARSPEEKKRKTSCSGSIGVSTDEDLDRTIIERADEDRREQIREKKRRNESMVTEDKSMKEDTRNKDMKSSDMIT
ncbi:protein FAM133B-like [Coccinella septempunctata]|uniref:protein FAM133B-like n=1 Tax=Coccinella septempunctata TaxID=41139 RepID=UPI001D05D160|nr:protein FAM133B-like [Coccinella septempunctata]XP_044760378.1 protein FAM133B-like [Coccinella septempunctata]